MIANKHFFHSNGNKVIEVTITKIVPIKRYTNTFLIISSTMLNSLTKSIYSETSWNIAKQISLMSLTMSLSPSFLIHLMEIFRHNNLTSSLFTTIIILIKNKENLKPHYLFERSC
jgi:hypothetical protein